MSTRRVLADILGILDGLTIEPRLVSIEDCASGPIAKIDFKSRGDIETYVAADKAKVRVSRLTHRAGLVEYSALYDRPGRKMLLMHNCFPHHDCYGETP